MDNRFESFISNIPKAIYNDTKKFIGQNIAVFFPDKYVMDKTVVLDDYHFVIFHTTPPPVIINGKEMQYKKGRLIYVVPGTEMTVKSIIIKSPIKYIAININEEYFKTLLMKVIGTFEIKPSNECYYSYRLLDFIELFIQELSYGENICPLMIESIENQIVVQLFRDTDMDLRMFQLNYSQAKNYVNQAIKYIDQYYSSNISINEICDNIYISPCHFQRIFKSTMNKTPYQYIMGVRIEKAKKMLKKHDNSIAEIARLCGFVSSGHFSTLFKKIEGITPSEYRNAIKL